MMGPGVPPNRVEALRMAFDLTMKDTKFLADAAAMRLEIDAVGGAEIEDHVRRMFSMPRPLIEKASAMIKAALGSGTLK